MTTDNCLIGENYRDLRQEKVKQRKAIIKNGKFTLSNFNLFVPNAPFLYALKTSEKKHQKTFLIMSRTHFRVNPHSIVA